MSRLDIVHEPPRGRDKPRARDADAWATATVFAWMCLTLVADAELANFGDGAGPNHRATARGPSHAC